MIELHAYAAPQENKGECLLCKAPLVYLVRDEAMECAVCGKKEPSKTRCVNGHYVCSACHAKGVDSLVPLCLAQRSRNPAAILEQLMDAPFCHMHGPEHHVLVGASLMTAYANAGGDVSLQDALLEMLPEAFGDQLHSKVAGMVVAAVGVLARTDVLHVHEHVTVFLRHGCLLGIELNICCLLVALYHFCNRLELADAYASCL